MRIRSGIGAAIGIVAAVALHTLFERFLAGITPYVQFLSLVVIMYAVKKEEIFGSVLGTVCGLVQDSFSAGIFGISGLAKTLTGFSAGYISRKLNVNSPVRIFLLVYILILMEIFVWDFLYWFISAENMFKHGLKIFYRPVATSFLGALLFVVLKKYKFFREV